MFEKNLFLKNISVSVFLTLIIVESKMNMSHNCKKYIYFIHYDGGFSFTKRGIICIDLASSNFKGGKLWREIENFSIEDCTHY